MTPITEDFARIAAELKRLEQEKVKTPPAPEPQPEPTSGWLGGCHRWLGGCHDYDPA